MKPLNIACTRPSMAYVHSGRDIILIEETDFTDIAAVVLTDLELDLKWIEKVNDTYFGIPIIIIARKSSKINPKLIEKGYVILDGDIENLENNSYKIEKIANEYQEKVLPPFFKSLANYMELHNVKFNCPGHQGGQYFKKHPAGRYLYDFYGENIFLTDICNADVALGDLLIHEGPPADAQINAARIYNANKTYFVMNGTSTANAITINALVAPDDLVLFDRNNHKSVYTAALMQAFLKLRISIKRISTSEIKRGTLIIKDSTMFLERMQVQAHSIRCLHLWMSMRECRKGKPDDIYGLSA